MGALEASQWFPAHRLARLQSEALRRTAAHAARYSPVFGAHLKRAGLRLSDILTPAGFLALPPLQRRDFQAPPDQLFCSELPASHRPVAEGASSGSTGEPVKVRRTTINQRDWRAMTMRMHQWYDIGRSARYCVSRARLPGVIKRDTWGLPAALFGPTGPMLAVPNDISIAEQAAAMAAFSPDILLAYPSAIIGLAQHLDHVPEHAFRPRQIRTIGETLHPQHRAEISRRWGCPILDIYSSEETGYISLQCPSGDLHHVMAETLIVEVLDVAGRPCREGEIGRVVVTDLHNLATPIIRYAIGDYAEAGGTCPCGRGLPTLRRVMGRERNLIVMPDGSRHWPMTGRDRFREVAPIVQYQMIQHDRERVEVRFVAERAVAASEEAALRALVWGALGYRFELDFSYFDGRLPLGPTGKFEEFVCRVPADP